MQFSVKSALYLIAATFMLAGCSSSTENDIDYLAVKSDKDSNWGMIGPDGKILFDDEFENRPSAVINGLFTVEENKGISVYKAAEKPEACVVYCKIKILVFNFIKKFLTVFHIG